MDFESRSLNPTKYKHEDVKALEKQRKEIQRIRKYFSRKGVVAL